MNKKMVFPFIGILFGTATSTLMQTVIATISPQLVESLGGTHLYGWIFSGYLLFSTITIPLFAKLADFYGYKKFYMIGMVVFLLGSLLCGLSSSIEFLIGSRILQGIGAGALGPVTIALIGNLFSLEERGKAMGMYAATQLLSNAVGPVIAGIIAQASGWQWAFFMVIPFGIISMGLIYIAPLTLNKAMIKVPFYELDILGALLLGVSVSILIQGFTMLGKNIINITTWTMLAVSIIIFILFFFQEKKHKNPVIPPRLISIVNIRLANGSAFLIGIIMYGAIAILPLYSLDASNSKSFYNGIILIPLMVGMSIGIIISGAIIKKYSYKALARTGWSIAFIGLLGLSILCMLNIFGFFTYIGASFIGFALGMLLPTFLIPAQNAVSKNEQAVVGGLVQLSRNLGGAIGIPILTGLITLTKYYRFSFATKYFPIFVFLDICTILGLFIGTQYKGSVGEEIKYKYPTSET